MNLIWQTKRLVSKDWLGPSPGIEKYYSGIQQWVPKVQEWGEHERGDISPPSPFCKEGSGVGRVSPEKSLDL